MEKVEKQPEGPGQVGWEKDPGADSEAGGRGKRTVLYTCWNDGAGNYVDPDSKWFSCWRCGSIYTGM
jgi:hypothetical protein